MRMFHFPSNLEILDPFWDLPQRPLKDWGKTPLFFTLLSLHPHPEHAISRLTVAIYPAPGPRVRRTYHLWSSEEASLPRHGLPSVSSKMIVRQRRTVFNPLTLPLKQPSPSQYCSVGHVWFRRATSARDANSHIHPSLPDAATTTIQSV